MKIREKERARLTKKTIDRDAEELGKNLHFVVGNKPLSLLDAENRERAEFMTAEDHGNVFDKAKEKL